MTATETPRTKHRYLTIIRLKEHRQPKLKMLGVQCNVTYAMLHNYANVMTPALQHMEVLCYNGLNL